MSLIEQYEAAIYRGEIDSDPEQREILEHMQRLAEDLQKKSDSWFPWRKKHPIKGLYIYSLWELARLIWWICFISILMRKKGEISFSSFYAAN